MDTNAFSGKETPTPLDSHLAGCVSGGSGSNGYNKAKTTTAVLSERNWSGLLAGQKTASFEASPGPIFYGGGGPGRPIIPPRFR